MLNCVDAMDFVDTLCGHTFYSDDAISEERLSIQDRALNISEHKLRHAMSFRNKAREILMIDNVPELFKVECHSGEGLLHHLAATYEVVPFFCLAGQLMKER